MSKKCCAKLHRKEIENCYQKFVKLTIYKTERSQKHNSCQPVRPSFHVVNINFRRLLFLFDVPFLFPGFILSTNASFSFSYCVKYLHDISNTPQGNKTNISQKGPHYLYNAVHPPGAILVVSVWRHDKWREVIGADRSVDRSSFPRKCGRTTWGEGTWKISQLKPRPPDPCGMAGVYDRDLTRLMCVKKHI